MGATLSGRPTPTPNPAEPNAAQSSIGSRTHARYSPAELVTSGEHGVDLDYLRRMDGAGYRLGDIAAPQELRDHGVDGDYVREMASAGLGGLDPDQLQRACDHGVDGRFVRRGCERRRGSVEFEAIVDLRDRGGPR